MYATDFTQQQRKYFVSNKGCFMMYSKWELKLNQGKYVLEHQDIDDDREEREIVPMIGQGGGWVYYPTGEKEKYKQVILDAQQKFFDDIIKSAMDDKKKFLKFRNSIGEQQCQE